ncbi:MAG: SURF1 family protein [Rhizobiaceae bacterium]
MTDATQTPPRMSRTTTIFMAIGCLVTFAILLSLGTWQVERLAWKEGLIATIDERIVAEPRPLTDIETRHATTRDVEYWPITLEGVFHHDRERHYLATWRGQSGFQVLTPLELADGRFIFVNRGFVPYDRKDPAGRPEGQVEGVVELSGLSRRAEPEKPSIIVPDNDPAKNVFYWKDLSAMASSVGLADETVLPFLVDADDAANPGGLPIGGITRIELPNNHLQYAVTWYGLAATLLVVIGAWLWKNRRRRPRTENSSVAPGDGSSI